MIYSYKDLLIWQKGLELCDIVYTIIETFPKDERFALADQMRRAAISVPSNIAEGYCRNSSKDYIRFLRIAFGSLAELETQIIICQKRKYITTNDSLEKVNELMKMTNSLIKKVAGKNSA